MSVVILEADLLTQTQPAEMPVKAFPLCYKLTSFFYDAPVGEFQLI